MGDPAVKRLLLLVSLLLCAHTAQGQTERLTVTVTVESGFVRVLPSLDAELAASVFEGDRLDIVGRNLDGLWFEVRRPGRMTNLGWIFNELVDWEFDVAALPLTDFSTGLIGPQPLDADPGFAVMILIEAVLREGPSTRFPQITLVPHSVVIPLLERDRYASWLRVYYLGYYGWVSNITVREVPNVMEVPLAPNLPPDQSIALPIIPIEIQLAQVERLRAYVLASRDLAANLASFWWNVYTGQVMPCEPPPFVLAYPYSENDVRELPELGRYVPRLADGVAALNAAIEPLTICGAFIAQIVRDARNNAINARVIFDSTLDLLDNLETIITE